MPAYNQLNEILGSPYQEEKKKSQTESLLRGAAQGASLGYADELAGAIDALKNIATKQSPSFSEAYTKGRDESRQEYKQAEQDNPKTYRTGDIAASVGTAFVPGIAPIRSAKGMAALGALGGAGRSEGESIGEVAKDAAISGAIGAGVGKAVEKFPSLLKMFSKEKAPMSLPQIKPGAGRPMTPDEAALLNPEIAAYKQTGQASGAVKALDDEVMAIQKANEDKLRQEAQKWGFGDNLDEYLIFREKYHKFLRDKDGLIPKVTEEMAQDVTKKIAI